MDAFCVVFISQWKEVLFLRILLQKAIIQGLSRYIVLASFSHFKLPEILILSPLLSL